MRKQGLYLQQNTKTPGLRGGGRAGDGAARIATHYKFALDHVFARAPEVVGFVKRSCGQAGGKGGEGGYPYRAWP